VFICVNSVSIDVKSDVMSDSEDSDDSETKAKPPSKRFEPNVSQFKTNLIPGSAFRSKSQLVRNERCVRRRDHLLADPREADDGDDSDATIIDETYAETVDDWRNGPAKYWYDLMDLPEDCEDYNYGLVVRNKSASSDWMHSSADTRVDPEDAFNLVSQIKWENEVIWDPDVVAQKVMDRAKKLEPTTGWLPIGVTRSAPDFCKEVDCLNVNTVSDTVDTSMCGISATNKCNNNSNNNFTKITDKTKDNAKTPINGLSKNLRKRKRNSVVNGLSDNRNETEATVEVKKSRWVSTLAEENRELVLNVWEDEIIWDTEAMDRKLEPKIIPFSGDDDNVILAFDEMMDEDTTDSHTADPLNESTDQFNISNDEFYASVVKVDNNVTHSLIIKHSIPAIKMDAMLFPTCLLEFYRPVLKRSKILRSRVPHDVLFCSNRIQMNENLNEDQNQTAKDLTKYTINTVSELSARNGEVVVMEYSEEDPPFLMRVGMGSQIVNYFQVILYTVFSLELYLKLFCITENQ
jgi:transcription initiation factor TFIID subunit 1